MLSRGSVRRGDRGAQASDLQPALHSVRVTAVNALGRIGGSVATTSLKTLLSDDATMHALPRSLLSVGSVAPRPRFRSNRSCRNEKESVGLAVVNALNNIGGNAATAGLRRHSDPSPAVKFGAARKSRRTVDRRRRRCLEIRVGEPTLTVANRAQESSDTFQNKILLVQNYLQRR